jgi:hypothetical protein
MYNNMYLTVGFLWEKQKEKDHYEKPRRMRKYNIKMDLRNMMVHYGLDSCDSG